MFQTKSSIKKRSPCELHLAVLLKYLGCDGNENTALKMGIFFGVRSAGTILEYCKRCGEDIYNLKDDAITWPDDDEKEAIAKKIKISMIFVFCIGVIDGT